MSGIYSTSLLRGVCPSSHTLVNALRPFYFATAFRSLFLETQDPHRSMGLELTAICEAQRVFPQPRVLASQGRMLRGGGAPSAKKNFPDGKGNEVCCKKGKLTLTPQGLARPWWSAHPGLLCELRKRAIEAAAPGWTHCAYPWVCPSSARGIFIRKQASAGPEWTPACSAGMGLAAMTSRWAKSDPTQLCGARMPVTPKCPLSQGENATVTFCSESEFTLLLAAWRGVGR